MPCFEAFLDSPYLSWKLPHEPFQRFDLIEGGRTPYLNQKVNPFRTLRRDILRTFVANRAKCAQVRQLIRAAFLLVDDVSDMQSRSFRRIVRMRLPRNCATHLAGVAIPFEDHRPDFFGYLAGEGGAGWQFLADTRRVSDRCDHCGSVSGTPPHF